jgi:four helix bundle protein
MAFRFEGLEVFQLAIDYAAFVYQVTKKFPREEMFGLTGNLRRRATSIANNIAEGSGRGTRRDFMHFVDVAFGSLAESVASCILAERLGYLKEPDLDEVRARADRLGRKLQSFKRSLATSDPRRAIGVNS